MLGVESQQVSCDALGSMFSVRWFHVMLQGFAISCFQIVTVKNSDASKIEHTMDSRHLCLAVGWADTLLAATLDAQNLVQLRLLWQKLRQVAKKSVCFQHRFAKQRVKSTSPHKNATFVAKTVHPELWSLQVPTTNGLRIRSSVLLLPCSRTMMSSTTPISGELERLQL